MQVPVKNEKRPTLLILSEMPILSDKNSPVAHALEILKQSFNVELMEVSKHSESQLIRDIKKNLPSLPIVQDKVKLLDPSLLEAPRDLKEFKNRKSKFPKNLDDTTKALIEAFQTRYHDAQLQIRQMEIKLEEITKTGAPSQEVKDLQLKMDALANRQKSWIKSLTETLQAYKSRVKKPKGKS